MQNGLHKQEPAGVASAGSCLCYAKNTVYWKDEKDENPSVLSREHNSVQEKSRTNRVCLLWVAGMTENREKIGAVQRMQDYIMAHYHEEVTLRELAKAAMYSPWHALRAFAELTGKTPFEYLRSVRRADAATKLRDTTTSVLDIALESAFGSHEGFTKAFSREFAISPQKYRKESPPLPLFSYYPVFPYHNYRLSKKGKETMSSTVCFYAGDRTA
jgi:AraC-like DNA-binding protein